MTGLLGWIDVSGHEPVAETLEKMMTAAGGVHAKPIGTVSKGVTMAVWETHDPASQFEANEVKAAVLGHANWDDTFLQARAEQDGLAASLVQAYRTHGADCLKKLHGAFALALVDAGQESALIAVDRLGVQPMCFANIAGNFVFASDARAAAAYPGVGNRLDSQAIYDYLFFHMVPSPGTVFHNVEKLLPGECAIYRKGHVERKFYWHLAYREETSASFEQKAARLKSVLQNAVGTSADSEQTGAFLSGGTDSSTVSGMLAQALKRPVDTFSIGFEAEGYDEMAYARIASRHFGTRPHEYYVTPEDVVAAIPKIAAAYDEPFGNASVIPTYYCAKLARDAGVKVMLAGDGGDEIFGGNARYAKQKVFEIYWRLPAWLRQSVIEPGMAVLPGTVDNLTLARKLKSYVAQASVPLPDRLETYNFLRRERLDQIFVPEFLGEIRPGNPEALMREVYDRTDSASFINRMLHLDLKFTLADNDLRKVNRACTLGGVAVRYPMLDETVVAFSAGLSADDKVRGQQLRYFFKKAVGDFLPADIITKSKHGFGLPFGLWMEQHGPLRDLAYDSLQAFRARGYVQPAYIDNLIAQHRSGHASYYGVMIWVVMMLEQWLVAHRL